MSPAQRHAEEDITILAAHHALYQKSKARHPCRWSGPTRNGSPIAVVSLNPEREIAIKAALDISTEKRNIA